MPLPARVAVLASGGGTNLQALIDHFHPAPQPAARVELVVAGRAGIGALERARYAGIATLAQDPAVRDTARVAELLLAALERHRIDLVVLAGYLRLVPTAVVERYHGRMLNIHPALLPAFGGMGMYGIRVHRAVIESGVRVSGATVHLVDERYDQGPILAQWPVPVLPDDAPETLAARVLRVEHRLLPLVVEALTRDQPAASPADPLAFELVGADAPEAGSLRALLSRLGRMPLAAQHR